MEIEEDSKMEIEEDTTMVDVDMTSTEDSELNDINIDVDINGVGIETTGQLASDKED
jgi:hypothetical protein